MGAVAKSAGELVGSVFGGGSQMAPPPPLPPAPEPTPPRNQPKAVAGMGGEGARAAAAGYGSTVITSPEGLKEGVSTSKKQLLGA